MSPRAIALAVLPVLALLMVLALVAAVRGGPETWESPLRGVSAEDFASLGIEVAEPGANPRVGRAEAIQEARENEVGDVRQARLARMIGGKRSGRLVWVINFDPETTFAFPPLGYTGPVPIRTTAAGLPDYGKVIYKLAFIDASSGKWLYGEEESEPPNYLGISH